MTANSKLNKEQREDRRYLLSILKDSFGSTVTYGMYTVAKIPEFLDSKMARFSVSVCSEDETKFRRKVGEYHALNKMFVKHEYVLLPNTISAQDFAHMLDTMTYGT